ncbi:MAG: glycosyltransferase family 4 protein [Gammaproteobacteria bacterium]|nr:glycosyltransferase family 4 protein [Gammaproteobacteria bacterium]
MIIGFYAPMKHPGHPVPSGDRKIANLFIELFQGLGHTVKILSVKSSWEGKGDAARQEESRSAIILDLERLKKDRETRKLDLVFVYHVYHKSPDWLGLDLARFLKVPYLIAEASFAPRQAGGDWAVGHERAKACIRSADAILCLNPVDEHCISELLPNPGSMKRIMPFVANPDLGGESPDRRSFANMHENLNVEAAWLTCVAMMRSGDKLRSYRELSAALEAVSDENWNLIVIGDGARFGEVRSLFSSIDERCLFTGELDQIQIARWFRTADCYVWPSVNEAFGMALLEATSYGLPTLSYDYGGVGTIIEDGANGFLVPPDDRSLFIDRLKLLVNDQAVRSRMRAHANRKFLSDHSLRVAQTRISEILERFDVSS